MSVQEVSVMVPPLRPVPRGAVWAADAAAWLLSRLRLGLEAIRTRLAVDRAARRDARGRAELMALASRYRATQPEFAKDLLAAANNDRDR